MSSLTFRLTDQGPGEEPRVLVRRSGGISGTEVDLKISLPLKSHVLVLATRGVVKAVILSKSSSLLKSQQKQSEQSSEV